MKVYGALEAAQIEWFTNAGKPAASSYPFRVIYVTDLKQIQVSDGTNWNPSALYTYTAGTLPAAGASNQYQVAFITDTLQVKVSNGTEWKTIGARLDTYTSGTIPAAASNTNSIIWVSDLQQVQVSNGSAWVQVGSKAGTKNYFSQNNANADFETNSVSPWSACTLTFSSGVPSGAPTLTATQMAIATTATTPLSGTYSMLLSKSAANAQYQGFISGALTIDREDTAKVLYGSFYYEVVSGTIDLSGSSTQSLEIWIYNTVSGQWTQPAGYRGMNQSSGVGKVVFSFQTDGTYANNAYKIAVITQQTGTSAFVVEFDDFQVGPQAIVLGSAMTDKISFSPALTNAGNATATGTYQRIGSNALIEVIVTIGSSLPTGTIKVGKPNNLTFDYSGNTMINTSTVLGQTSASGATYAAGLRYEFSTSTFNLLGGNGQQFWNATVPVTWASGDKIYISATVPIAGWGSFSQMSSDSSQAVIAMSGYSTSTITVNNTTSQLPLGGVYTDTLGTISGNQITIPVSGYYDIFVRAIFGTSSTATNNHALYIYKNGSPIAQDYIQGAVLTPNLQNYGMVANTAQKFNAGDVITFYFSTNFSSVVQCAITNYKIVKLSSSSVITATETVAARYTNASGQSIPNNSTVAITGWTKDFDTHQMFNTSSGIVTIPISGKYTFSNMTTYNSGSITLPSEFSIDIQQAGSVSRSIKLGAIFAQSSNSYFVSVVGSTAIHCNAGDTVTIVAFQSSGAARTLAGGASFNHLSITRVGN